MVTRLVAHVGFCALIAATAGCAGLKLQLVDASVRKPSNIAVYFTVDTKSGEPVPDLKPADFRIYEDDRPVSQLESKQTILNPEIAAVHYTLLLVDMSGSVSGSGDVPNLVNAASSFSDRVGPYQKIAVYAFDGSAQLTPIVGFGSGNVRSGLSALTRFRPRDPSTNLYGAVVEGIDVLHRQMEQAPVPLRFGTLVVFTDGTDHAHRVDPARMREALDSSELDVFVVGVGAEVNDGEMRSIGRSGTFTSKSPSDVAKGFDEIAKRIEGFSRRYYLLSYCSPARAGEHEVKIEAAAKGTSGTLSHRFKADGFGPNCDPNQKPSFDIRHPRAPRAEGAGSAPAPRHHGKAAPPPPASSGGAFGSR